MPIHDWTRVSAGTFHSFHLSWIAEIMRALNHGVLPEGYYAQAEQAAYAINADVLTLKGFGGDSTGNDGGGPAEGNGSAGVAVATAPPRVAMSDTVTEAQVLAARRRRLVIRHATGDRIVALVEIVSPGNKERRPALAAFVDKAVAALNEGYHLMLLDLFPPGPYDPLGIHGAIWQLLGGSCEASPGKPLTLASYAASGLVTCYVEPTSVGAELVPMPLFLDPGHYVNVPLEQGYLAAYDDVPMRWQRVIEAT